MLVKVIDVFVFSTFFDDFWISLVIFDVSVVKYVVLPRPFIRHFVRILIIKFTRFWFFRFWSLSFRNNSRFWSSSLLVFYHLFVDMFLVISGLFFVIFW